MLAGTLAGLLVLGPSNMTLTWLWPALFVAALPVFVAGLLEDITKDIGASKRLLAAFGSAAIAWWLLGGVSRVGMAPVDYVLSFWPVSLVFTMFAVGGCTHALNIVDGMNGLAGMVATLMAVSISLVALQVGDMPIFMIAAALASATLGFLVWNFPFGRVFLGDGGAYFLGFMLAELAVLLVVRNPSVSPFYALAVLFYPYSKPVFDLAPPLQTRRAGGPARRAAPAPAGVPSPGARDLQPRRRHAVPALCNALASPYMWVLALIGLVPATIWWDNAWMLGASLLVFAGVYIWLYARLVSWRRPGWLLLPSVLKTH